MRCLEINCNLLAEIDPWLVSQRGWTKVIHLFQVAASVVSSFVEQLRGMKGHV